jgi:hypothetical protein
LNSAVIPLREPEAVNLRARLRPGMTPADLQVLLEQSLKTPLRDPPRITLEELDGEEVVVRIAATPRVSTEGRQLASELLGIVSRETRAGAEASAADGESASERTSARPAAPPRPDGQNGGDSAAEGDRKPASAEHAGSGEQNR